MKSLSERRTSSVLSPSFVVSSASSSFVSMSKRQTPSPVDRGSTNES
jgi:hypothetical protein